MDKQERHSYFAGKLETRAEQEGGKRYIEGYFAVFDVESEIYPGEYERIAPGAFAGSLQRNDIRCLFNHHSGTVLGRTGAGTLTLREDGRGLWGRVEINPDDREAMDIYARVARGDISGCSFGFVPLREDYAEHGGALHWTVYEADTAEVSIVTFPAYPDTEVEARKRARGETQKEQLQRSRAQLKQRLEELKLC